MAVIEKKEFIPDRRPENTKPDLPSMGSEFPGVPSSGTENPRKFFKEDDYFNNQKTPRLLEK